MIDVRGIQEVPVVVKVNEDTLFHVVIGMIEKRYKVRRHWYRKEMAGPYWEHSSDSRMDDECVGHLSHEQEEAMQTIRSMIKIAKEIENG